MLNGLPWKGTEMILLFLRLHPSTTFHISDSFVDNEGYSISSKGYIPWDIVKIQCSKYNHGVTQNEISASSGLN